MEGKYFFCQGPGIPIYQLLIVLWTFLVSLDAINPIDYTVYGGVGLEYSWHNIAFIRCGTHLFHDTAGLSLGGGLKWSMLVIDYAYVNYGILKETHQFGISLEL